MGRAPCQSHKRGCCFGVPSVVPRLEYFAGMYQMWPRLGATAGSCQAGSKRQVRFGDAGIIDTVVFEAQGPSADDHSFAVVHFTPLAQ